MATAKTNALANTRRMEAPFTLEAWTDGSPCEPQRATREVEAVVTAGDAQRPRDAARPPRQALAMGDAATQGHPLHALDRLEGPDQHRPGASLLPPHHVEAVVHAVGEVDV